MKKPINKETVIGRIYEHNLAEKVTGENSKHPGTTYIGGTIDVATDEAGMNIIQVNFTYVTETTSKGSKNNTFTALKNIIDNGKTIVTDGMEAATKVKIDTALALNDFYTERNGDVTLVSARRNQGGFVTIVSSLPEEKDRNKFEVDMFINNIQHIEADEEKGITEDYVVLKGAIFDFKNSILPMNFVVRNAGGMKYFESLDISPQNPVFTKIWGSINSSVIITKSEEESAFGEPIIKEYTKNVKEWVVTGTSKPDAVYEIGDEVGGITAEEVKKALAEREIYLATVKQRQDEYKASTSAKNDEVPFGKDISTAPAAAGGFNF